jgi:hypothetical protein
MKSRLKNGVVTRKNIGGAPRVAAVVKPVTKVRPQATIGPTVVGEMNERKNEHL